MNKYGLLMNVNLLYIYTAPIVFYWDVALYVSHPTVDWFLRLPSGLLKMFAQMIGSCHSLFKVKCVTGYDHWDFPKDTTLHGSQGEVLVYHRGNKILRVYDLMIDQNDGLNGRQFGRSCLGNDSKIISGQDFQTSRKFGGEKVRQIQRLVP